LRADDVISIMGKYFSTARQDIGMKVLIPGALRSYTEKAEVKVGGTTLGEVLAALDLQYPGIRFRIVDEQDAIRRHIRIFVNGEQARDLSQALRPTDEVIIVQALSGG
jgi:molybdopterin converting factor small subunit